MTKSVLCTLRRPPLKYGVNNKDARYKRMNHRNTRVIRCIFFVCRWHLFRRQVTGYSFNIFNLTSTSSVLFTHIKTIFQLQSKSLAPMPPQMRYQVTPLAASINSSSSNEAIHSQRPVDTPKEISKNSPYSDVDAKRHDIFNLVALVRLNTEANISLTKDWSFLSNTSHVKTF